MKKKGLSNISIIFFSLVFIIFWSISFAPLLSEWGHQAVINGSYTGIEALFYENLNFVVAIIFIIFIIAIGFANSGG